MIDLDAVGYGNGLIYVGIPRERMYLTQFVDNRDRLLSRLAQSGNSCGFWQAEGHRVDRNRDQIVQAFLRHEQKPEWLLMIDSDMEHPEDAPIRLAAWKKPIVGALYFHRGSSHDPFVFDYIGYRKDEFDRDTHTWAPRRDEVYQWLEDQHVPIQDGALVIDNPTRSPLWECDALGTGCMIFHRSVFENMQAPWFEYRQFGNSEDLMFCKEAKEAGFPVHADVSTICGHYNWVPMGQAQFRMNYINRGINMTSYTKGMAANWLTKCFGGTLEENIKAVEKGENVRVADIWKKRFGKKKPSAEEVDSFYRDPEVGRTYVMELLHWNFTTSFFNLRKHLVTLRDANVLEIGSGIGTVALQLWLQGCNILASEVNPVLRDFMDERYQDMAENTIGAVGQLSIVDDGWIEKTPDESLDAIVSLDVLEHLPWNILAKTMDAAWKKLKPGGTFFYHANWHQQDIYPMHFDYEDRFPELLNGFEQISNMELKKVMR